MTKKDYVKFADMLKDMKIGVVNRHTLSAINEVVERTANIFAADNPNFDRARFLEACGVES